MEEKRKIGDVEQLWDLDLDELRDVERLMDAYFYAEMQTMQDRGLRARQLKRFRELMGYGIKSWFSDPTWLRACEIIEARLKGSGPANDPA